MSEGKGEGMDGEAVLCSPLTAIHGELDELCEGNAGGPKLG